MMKHLLAAAALAPVLVACASADARDSPHARTDDDGVRVLIVNGRRIELGEERDAAAAIEAALSASRDERVHVELELDEAVIFSHAERAAFAAAMSALASGLAHDAMIVAFDGSRDFDIDFDLDLEDHAEFDEAELRRHVERAEAHAERHAERMERHAARMARHGERLAERAEAEGRRAALHGRRMEIVGLEAGLHGMRSGLAGVEEALERGWRHEDGERTALSAEDREALEEARAELTEEMEDMRARLADARERHGVEGSRAVRIVRRDGDVRAWVDGEEVTGSQLDRLLAEEGEGRLAGAPQSPEPPRAPEE